MLVTEKKAGVVVIGMDRFGEVMVDGRLTAPSDNKVYRLREAILHSKQMERPLTDNEMKQYEV